DRYGIVAKGTGTKSDFQLQIFPRISVPKSAFVRRSAPDRTNGRFQKHQKPWKKWWARQGLNL
ncbi:MAG TPA: hypothetical protein VGG48_20375, partial [Rhizomicrobium sp.]